MNILLVAQDYFYCHHQAHGSPVLEQHFNLLQDMTECAPQLDEKKIAAKLKELAALKKKEAEEVSKQNTYAYSSSLRAR
jgi:hypothetical protein